MAASHARKSRSLGLLLLCIPVSALVAGALGAPAVAKKKHKLPPWAGKTYTGKSQLQTGEPIGAVTLKVASNGKSLTYTVPWKCASVSETSTHKVTVKSNGTFKGGVIANSGSPAVSFFLTGSFAGAKAKRAGGEMNGSVTYFTGPGVYEDRCETGNVAYPGIIWKASRK